MKAYTSISALVFGSALSYVCGRERADVKKVEEGARPLSLLSTSSKTIQDIGYIGYNKNCFRIKMMGD